MDSVGMLLQSAVSEQRSFWKETQPYYLVSLFPTYDEWNDTTHSLSVGGSGLHQSFTCMASDVPSPDLMERLTYLFFHEMMHNWIGGTIKSADEERQYWFTEGFTEYFQTKLRLRSGVLSVDQYIKEINESTLKPYYASPVREMPNDSMTYQNFWSNYHYEKLPYQRGLLFALLLDISAKQEAGISLDDAMFNILSYARRYPDLRMNDERLLEHIEEAFGYSITPTYQKYIAQGQSIDWSIVPLPEGLSAERDADGVIQFALEPERSEEVGVFLKR
jgi:predicted metalloprotease with PDZ domain